MANGRNHPSISSARQRTHEGVDKIMDKAERISERSHDEMVRLKEKAVEMRENVDGYIRKNPEKSVLIAAGVGAVVGAIVVASIMRKKN